MNNFSFNQNVVPWGLSAHASGLYTCIKSCNISMSFSLTNFHQISHWFSVKAVWSFCLNSSALLNKMATVMPNLKNLLLENQESYEANI